MAQKTIPKPTWAKIKSEYVAGNKGFRELAREYGVSNSTICERAKKEGWKEKAEQIKLKAEQAVEERAINAQISNVEIANKTIHTLMMKIAEAAELIDASDTSATRQLTQCIKDLKDIGAFTVQEESTASISIGEELDKYGI